MGQIQTNTNVNTMKNVNTTSGSFLEGVAKQFLNWAHPRFRPTIQCRNKKQALPTPVYGTQVISVTFIHTWCQVMSNANLIQNSFIFSFCWRASFQASSLRSTVSLLNFQLHVPTNSTRPTFPPVAQLSQRHQQTATPRCSDFLTQSENKRSRQTPSRRTSSKDCVFVQEKL